MLLLELALTLLGVPIAWEVPEPQEFEFYPTRYEEMVLPEPEPEPEPEPVIVEVAAEPAPPPPPPPPPEPAPEPEPPAPREDSGSYPVLTGHRRVIADCESGNRLASGRAVEGSYNWTGINQQGSSASGAFQFIDSTWRWVAHEELGYTQYPTARSAPPHVQIEAFDWLWANGGSGHWAASRSCWGGLL